jgi:hypothetical protein
VLVVVALLVVGLVSFFSLASNGINGRGPPEAGRMPFMPAVSLNQLRHD